MTIYKEYVGIKSPNYLSGLYGIECESKDQDVLERFKDKLYNFGREWQIFHQSGVGPGTQDYHLFEFWVVLTPTMQETLLDFCIRFAEQNNLKCLIR